MINIDKLDIRSGRLVKEDGSYVNIADILDGATVTITNATINTLIKAEFEISAEITRPANTNAYSAGEIINGNGALTLPKLDFSGLGSLAGKEISITNATLLSSNGAAATKLAADVRLFNASSLSGQSVADASAFAPSAAQLKAKLATIIDGLTAVAFGTSAYVLKANGLALRAALDASSALYAAIIASNAYVPSSAETLTLTIKGYILA